MRGFLLVELGQALGVALGCRCPELAPILKDEGLVLGFDLTGKCRVVHFVAEVGPLECGDLKVV